MKENREEQREESEKRCGGDYDDEEGIEEGEIRKGKVTRRRRRRNRIGLISSAIKGDASYNFNCMFAHHLVSIHPQFSIIL